MSHMSSRATSSRSVRSSSSSQKPFLQRRKRGQGTGSGSLVACGICSRLWVREASVRIKLLAKTSSRRRSSRMKRKSNLTVRYSTSWCDDAPGFEYVHSGRDPDSRPPTNMFQRVGHLFFRLYGWARSAEGLVYVFQFSVMCLKS